jgi:hypothetical protein
LDEERAAMAEECRATVDDDTESFLLFCAMKEYDINVFLYGTKEEKEEWRRLAKEIANLVSKK